MWDIILYIIGLTLFLKPMMISSLEYVLDSDKTHSNFVFYFLLLALYFLNLIISIYG